MRKLWIFIIVLLIVASGTYYYIHHQIKNNKPYLILYGNVDVRQVDLGFRVFGRVTKMPFEEGDFVPKGAFMGEIDRQPYLDKVFEAQASVESAKRKLANAQLILKRREKTVGSGAVSDEDYEDALSSRDVYMADLKLAKANLGVAITDLKNTKVYCPTDGIILTRIREPGTVVNVAEPIYTLSIISPVWVRAFVAEPDLGHVFGGMKAEIYTDTNGGKIYKGQVGFISPVAEFTPKTVETTQLRTDLVYRLRIYADNPDQGLRQGMPVTVKLFFKQDEALK